MFHAVFWPPDKPPLLYRFGIVLPEQCKDPNFKFGTSTNMGTHTAKDLIYPLHDPYDDPDQATHERYVKTHGRYEAAEQKKMGYNWLAHGIDPMSFRSAGCPSPRGWDKDSRWWT